MRNVRKRGWCFGLMCCQLVRVFVSYLIIVSEVVSLLHARKCWLCVLCASVAHYDQPCLSINWLSTGCGSQTFSMAVCVCVLCASVAHYDQPCLSINWLSTGCGSQTFSMAVCMCVVC